MGFLINSWVLILFLLLATAIYIGVAVTMGVMVYRDAKARGMEPWLWTLISVFAPFFIGLLVYLAARSGKKPSTSTSVSWSKPCTAGSSMARSSSRV